MVSGIFPGDNSQGGGEAECPRDTSHQEISADLYREKRGKENRRRKEGKSKEGRWKIENGRGKVTK